MEAGSVAAVVVCCGTAARCGSSRDEGSWANPRDVSVSRANSGVALLPAARRALDLARYSCVLRPGSPARTGLGIMALVEHCARVG